MDSAVFLHYLCSIYKYDSDGAVLLKIAMPQKLYLLMTSASQATVQLISREPLSRSAALSVHVQALNTGDAAHRCLLSLC